jgi:hypothetical protein
MIRSDIGLEAYYELCAYTLTHGDSSFIHQHVVDAYAVQSATAETKAITVTFGLVGLYLHVERQFNGRQVQRAHQWLAREKRIWPNLTLPEARGALTAADVLVHEVGADRDQAISAWAALVWEAVASGETATAATIREIGRPLPSFRGA